MSMLNAIRVWVAPVATMAVVSVSLSISVPLFSLLLDRAGVSATGVGLNHTIAAVAMVGTALVLPRILAMLGVVPLMVWSIIALSLSMALIPLWESPWWWAVLRLGWGVAGTALFFASEFWLISTTPDKTRGRIVGVYVLILSGSYMLGPLLLNVLGIDSWLTYAVPTAIILASAIPVLIGRRLAPSATDEERPGSLKLIGFFWSDPVILWGVVLFGVIEFGALGLVTIWGLSSGFDRETSVAFVFWIAFGSMAFQIPVGWAADRFDRRSLLAIAGAVSFAMPLAILLWAESVAAISAVAFVWGGMAVSFYSLALIELGSRYRGTRLAEGNAAVVLAYGLGALAGPLAFGAAMDAIPPDGLLWLAAFAGGAYCALVLWRIATRPRSALDSQDETSS